VIVSSLRALLWVFAAGSFGAFVALFASRLPLAGSAAVESLVVDRALAWSSLQPLYPGVPAVVPGIPPVLPALSALAFALFGDTPVTPRVITLLAIVGAAAWLGAILRRETSDWTCGVAGAALFLTGYGLLGGPLGAARPEPLMFVLLLAGGVVLTRVRGMEGAIFSGVLFSLAALTHGAALAAAMAVFILLAGTERPRALGFGAALLLAYGGAHVALSWSAGPWYNFDMFDAVILRMTFDPLGLLRYLGQTLLGPLNVVAITCLMALALPVKPWQGPGGAWGCVGGGLLLASVFLTQVPGASDSAAILSVMALALMGPLFLQRVTHHLTAWPGSTRRTGQNLVLAALALQFVVLASRIPPPRF
jgi:hypothetical protein